MKLTVGPLAPAVYWRRRAVVLGALLFVVLVIAYSCSGSDPSGASNARGLTHSGSPVPTSPGPSATSMLELPLGNQPTTAASTQPLGQPSGSGAPATGPCADTELSVVPVPDPATVKQGVATIRQGTPLKISLKIKNVSNRSCTRDVGASAQELYLAQGTTKAWSSDACDALTGSETRTFGPSVEIEPYVVWNAKATSQGCASRPWAAVGSYQILGRLGSKLSDPVPLQITA